MDYIIIWRTQNSVRCAKEKLLELGFADLAKTCEVQRLKINGVPIPRIDSLVVVLQRVPFVTAMAYIKELEYGDISTDKWKPINGKDHRSKNT